MTAAKLPASMVWIPYKVLRMRCPRTKTPTIPMPTPASASFMPSRQNHQHDVAVLRAESHAKTYLMASLGHDERHYAVDAEGGQQQCEHGESAEENHAETVPGHLRVDDLLHRPDMRQGVSREIVSHDTAETARIMPGSRAVRTASPIQGQGIASKVRKFAGPLYRSGVFRCECRETRRRPAIPRVAQFSDMESVSPEANADRADFRRAKAIDKALADNDDLGAAGVVIVVGKRPRTTRTPKVLK